MPLAKLLDAIRVRLTGTTSPVLSLVGGHYPTVTGELPAAVISIADARPNLASVGRTPRQAARGALAVETSIDLSAPGINFPDGRVGLLSNDRRRVSLPHGPVVHESGAPAASLGAEDLRVARNGTAFVVTSGVPGPGEVRWDASSNTLTFGVSLPADGTLELAYFVGEWETRMERAQGTLSVEIFAADTLGLDRLCAQIDAMLRDDRSGSRITGLRAIYPTAFGPSDVRGAARAGARSRVLTYHFDCEIEEPLLGTGGGVIRQVEVQMTTNGRIESFAVTRAE